MKELFEEYGLFILSAILAILCIDIFLKLFAGETAILTPFFEDWLAHFGLH